MDCWYPITVFKKEYKGMFERNTKYTQYVPCGRCPACRRRKQNEWAYRIMEEAKYSRFTAFITLTYEDANLPFTESGQMTLDPVRFHKFTKDLRYRLGQFRYFGCGEYGDQFERPHYHIIIFYNGPEDLDYLKSSVEKCWTEGFTQFDSPVTAGRAKYCAKYSMKQIGFDYGDAIPPFARMSRRPGIGKKFLDHCNFSLFRKLDQWCVHDYQGTPYNLPRYFKERIYSRDEIEQHSLLLERSRFSRDDLHLELSGLDQSEFFRSVRSQEVERERLFIKHLQKENYGYKYESKPSKVYRPTDSGEDLITDEF